MANPTARKKFSKLDAMIGYVPHVTCPALYKLNVKSFQYNLS